jgi:ribonuclease P protein component
MLTKNRRVSKSLFDKVLKEGSVIHSSLFSLRFVPKSVDKYSHIAFVAPKSVAKGAVERNKLRRRGYSGVSKLQVLPSVCVFFYKKEAKLSPQSDISFDIEALLKRAKLL